MSEKSEAQEDEKMREETEDVKRIMEKQPLNNAESVGFRK